jgi:hypothetical protein
MHQRKANPYTEGSRELFDLAGQGRVDVFFPRRRADRRRGEHQPRRDRRLSRRPTRAFRIVRLRVHVLRRESARSFSARSTRSACSVPKVDFISAPGWSPPEVWRRGGPQALVTGPGDLRVGQGTSAVSASQSVHPGTTAGGSSRAHRLRLRLEGPDARERRLPSSETWNSSCYVGPVARQDRRELSGVRAAGVEGLAVVRPAQRAMHGRAPARQ